MIPPTQKQIEDAIPYLNKIRKEYSRALLNADDMDYDFHRELNAINTALSALSFLKSHPEMLKEMR